MKVKIHHIHITGTMTNYVACFITVFHDKDAFKFGWKYSMLGNIRTQVCVHACVSP